MSFDNIFFSIPVMNLPRPPFSVMKRTTSRFFFYPSCTAFYPHVSHLSYETNDFRLFVTAFVGYPSLEVFWLALNKDLDFDLFFLI